MNAPLNVVSLFAGVGGFERAFQQVGARPSASVEIDPAARGVLADQFPDTALFKDVTTVTGEQLRRAAMPAPRDDCGAQAKYDLYCQGLSLAEVAAEFGCSRQSVYELFKRRGWDLRSRPAGKPTVSFGGFNYTIGDNGYYRRTTGSRSLLHRDVWTALRGVIPDGWDIHHKDHDKTHNKIENLECLPKAEHASKYGTGCNQAVHRCGRWGGDANDLPAVDVLTAGWP